MDIDFKKLAPWNWFKKEQEEQQSTASLPVQRNDLPVAGGPSVPSCNCTARSTACSTTRFEASAFRRWPCHAVRRTGRAC